MINLEHDEQLEGAPDRIKSFRIPRGELGDIVESARGGVNAHTAVVFLPIPGLVLTPEWNYKHTIFSGRRQGGALYLLNCPLARCPHIA